jgi:hypothetical protein
MIAADARTTEPSGITETLTTEPTYRRYPGYDEPDSRIAWT